MIQFLMNMDMSSLAFYYQYNKDLIDIEYPVNI